MVAELTAPEQDAFARIRLEKDRAKRHNASVLAQWFVSALAQVIPHAVATGYRAGQATNEDGRYLPIPDLRLEKILGGVPGLDAQPKQRRRRTTAP